MATKAELEAEIAALKEKQAAPEGKGDASLRAALEDIARIGGRQGAIATDALK